MAEFVFNTSPSIVVERGAGGRLVEYCSTFNPKSVLVVTDRGIIAAGLLEQALAAFKSEPMRVNVFDSVESDPSDSTVLGATTIAKEHNVDLVVGFGGGSAMDVAKLVSTLAHPHSTQPLDACYGVGVLTNPRLPLIQVPTTAGTGSEVTPVAIVTTGDTTKSGVVSPILLPDMAILDATLTLGLPPHVTAATGIDAMVHAIEAYTSKIKKNPISDGLAKQALALLAPNVLKAVETPDNIEVREQMLVGACLAGQAFANAPVGAVHALAYPLGGHYHIPHGLSNALVLPHVMRFNQSACEQWYRELATVILPNETDFGRNKNSCSLLIDWLASLSQSCGLPTSLKQCDIPESALELLATEAMKQQRLLVNNPREVSLEDAKKIYQEAY